MDAFASRRERLTAMLAKADAEAFLITNLFNVRYLTGFSGDSSYLVLTKDRAVLVSDGRFTEQIGEECPALEAVIRPVNQNLYQATAALLERLGPRSVEFESTHVTVAEYESYRALAPTLNWKSGRERVEELRAIKDKMEIAQIREAIDIAERAFQAFRENLRTGDSEKELVDRLEMAIRNAGGQCSSFPSIVAAGERAALPHAPPSDRLVGDAELLLIDWGAQGRAYVSDLTRVLSTGEISGKFQMIYEVVLKAQAAAIEAIRPGAKALDIDAAARSVIAAAGYGDRFGHGLGHGIGLQVHEAPAVRQNSEAVLEAGMVITIEPGIYLPGWGGIRIEDDILVTPDGREVLTQLAKDLPGVVLGW